MDIDHIFIFSDNYGEEANQLVEFGLIEGSSRVHPGQGTANRKFYFHNFFLEILWVVDENDIQNKTTSITKLWDRSQYNLNGYSRFGLCVENTVLSIPLFQHCKHYYPKYLPENISIEFIENGSNPSLPWTFRTPFANSAKKSNEPRNHNCDLKTLTKAIFEVKAQNEEIAFISQFEDVPGIDFIRSERIHLTLEFDHLHQKKEQTFNELGLTIKY